MSVQLIQEKHQTKLFKKHFAFFAFTEKQFNKQVNRNFKYAALGGGLMVPVEFADKVFSALGDIHTKAIEKHQATTDKKTIIWDELSNYETQITGELDDVYAALVNYPGITKEDIKGEFDVYMQHCIDNNYF